MRTYVTGGRAFTLVELMVVVVILGILAAVVVTRFGSTVDETRRAAFVNDTRTWVQTAELYHARTGTYIDDSGSGALPAGWTNEWIDTARWVQPTPVGGVWDTEYNDNGVTSAVGVHFDGTGDTRDDAYMLLVDQVFDDNNLSTGAFRRLGDARYYYVMAD